MAPQEGAAVLERPHGGRGVLMGGASGVAPATRRDAGRGDGGGQRRPDRRGHGGRGHRGGSQRRPAARHRSRVARPDPDGDELGPRDRTAGAVRRSGGRRGAGARGEGSASRRRRAGRRGCRPGSVLVDISIDQGGCFETSHVTTHSDPTYVVDGVVHYCVGNMPGAVPRTSTYALTNVTLPYVLSIADLGLDAAIARRPRARARRERLRRGHHERTGRPGTRSGLRPVAGRGGRNGLTWEASRWGSRSRSRPSGTWTTSPWSGGCPSTR